MGAIKHPLLCLVRYLDPPSREIEVFNDALLRALLGFLYGGEGKRI
jgi:hypothetical protein